MTQVLLLRMVKWQLDPLRCEVAIRKMVEFDFEPTVATMLEPGWDIENPSVPYHVFTRKQDGVVVVYMKPFPCQDFAEKAIEFYCRDGWDEFVDETTKASLIDTFHRSLTGGLAL